MSGERSSTVRRRRAGHICALCSNPLPEPHTPGEQLCSTCAQTRPPTHRVYMSFMFRDGWYCQFLEADLQTPLRRKLRFASQEKVMELARRGGCDMNLNVQQAFEHELQVGRGGIWLNLTEERYRLLK